MKGLMPEGPKGLPDLIERILDKGLVVNADIAVSVSGNELLGIRIRATLASFETAARYGMEFPAGTNFKAPGWQDAKMLKAACPECGNRKDEKLLLDEGCHICGWMPSKKSLSSMA